jgi:dTDP-4-dehydrorhamnose 3,5-epimerase
MIFKKTDLKDAYLIELEKLGDERGFFARSYCKKEFQEQGINHTIVQSNISYNKFRHTLRGMHYQAEPHREAKLIRCTKGGIYDVIIDIRPDSPTFKQWIDIELNEENGRMLYVPEGFAHGFLTLKDNTEVMYEVSAFYAPGAERGIMYNDPVFDISWPAEAEVISEKDQQWPAFEN